ncbi:MAG: hypothetical protein WCR96_05760 [Candidatus Methanomethylophilaceae archaeon]
MFGKNKTKRSNKIAYAGGDKFWSKPKVSPTVKSRSTSIIVEPHNHVNSSNSRPAKSSTKVNPPRDKKGRFTSKTEYTFKSPLNLSKKKK